MSKARPTETQEAEASVPVPEPRRRHGVGQSTFYEWRSEVRRYGSVRCVSSEGVDDENDRPKRMYVDLSLRNSAKAVNSPPDLYPHYGYNVDILREHPHDYAR